MNAPVMRRILYHVVVLLMTFNLLTCVHSQGTGDVWFSLNGTTYQNNSCVTLEDIGEGDDALLCMTNFTACCQPLYTGENGPVIGNWFFPNGTRVPSLNKEWDFNRNRGQMVVRMHRKRGGVEGIYRCEIPDSTNVNQSIYIGVYSAGTGVWFSLNGTTYQNNSCVTLEDIGDGDDALLCVTNLTACCGPPYTGVNGSVIGNWFFPNGTRVPSVGKRWDFNRKRGQMVVRLNRQRGGVEGIYRCVIPDSMNVNQSIYIGVYSASTALIPEETISAQTVRATGHVTVSSSIQTTMANGAITATVPVCSSMQPLQNCGAITTIQPTKSDGANVTTKTVLVSSGTLPAANSPSDGVTTTLVIIVVAVVIIVVVIVVGVVILRAKRRKQMLKIKNVTMENEGTEMKLKQEETTEKKTSSNADQPPYAEIQTEAPPNVPSNSGKLMEYSNQNTPLVGGYSEIELKPDDSKCALPAKPPRHLSLSDTMSEVMEFVYQDIDQHCDSTSTRNVMQEYDIYTEPNTTSSHTVDPDSVAYETVYSEPIQPSLFTDAVQTPSDCEDLQPYAPIYTIPVKLPVSEKVLFKVYGSNIREIHELGMGQFGKVILAETVGLSAKDLRFSESDDDKSKSTLVAVKKLKSDAQNATKEAFDKEVNFMSRLHDRNVIRILGVCYEDTPFIMMEYMEKGDLHQYLQKFKVHSTTDSEPQGQITTSTLVHIATQIASAMKYLASHNFVHRDLATRNCLVGPNYLVKISDFGMSRSLYDSHYYRIHGQFALPVRWMAFECFYGKFSQKTDVWAFGVTMWEIFTLAKVQPYSDMSDKQVVEDALKGKNRQTLARPYMCPLEVYKIMLECWAHNSKQRATFEKLFQLLTSIHIDE